MDHSAIEHVLTIQLSDMSGKPMWTVDRGLVVEINSYLVSRLMPGPCNACSHDRPQNRGQHGGVVGMNSEPVAHHSWTDHVDCRSKKIQRLI